MKHEVSNEGINHILVLDNFIDGEYDTFLSYKMHGKSLEDQMFKVEKVQLIDTDEKYTTVKH